jgi:hypothetical protein
VRPASVVSGTVSVVGSGAASVVGLVSSSSLLHPAMTTAAAISAPIARLRLLLCTLVSCH